MNCYLILHDSKSKYSKKILSQIHDIYTFEHKCIWKSKKSWKKLKFTKNVTTWSNSAIIWECQLWNTIFVEIQTWNCIIFPKYLIYYSMLDQLLHSLRNTMEKVLRNTLRCQKNIRESSKLQMFILYVTEASTICSLFGESTITPNDSDITWRSDSHF